MWKKIKAELAQKIDVKITGYISVIMFALTAAVLLYVIGLSAGAAGALPMWAAFAGFGIIIVNVMAIRLAKWGQRQTGRKLKLSKTAVWLNRGMIAVMVLIYGLGIIL